MSSGSIQAKNMPLFCGLYHAHFQTALIMAAFTEHLLLPNAIFYPLSTLILFFTSKSIRRRVLPHPAELFPLKLLDDKQTEVHAREKFWVRDTVLCAFPCSSHPLDPSLSSQTCRADSARDWRLCCGPLEGSRLAEVWEALHENWKESCTEQEGTRQCTQDSESPLFPWEYAGSQNQPPMIGTWMPTPARVITSSMYLTRSGISEPRTLASWIS